MVAPLTANIYVTHHASLNAIACMCQTMCDVTSNNVLGRLVQCEDYRWCEQKGGDRLVHTTQRENTAWLCLGLAAKSLSKF